MNLKSSKVNLHPASCKYLGLGHPWITEDSYTKKFPKDSFFLVGIDEKTKKEIALLIQDPNHKTVKARLWSLNPSEWEIPFLDLLKIRIEKAISKRKMYFNERENIFLINGESDQLPGLLVQKVKNELVIQYYAFFWKDVEKELTEMFKEFLPEIEDQWIQERNFDRALDIRSIKRTEESVFECKEFGIKYKIKINKHYDFGIYSDMSAIRKSMLPFLKPKGSLLNLFCYTGAFSLFALHHGYEKVISVDLSSKYLDWLDENLNLNPHLNKDFHQSLNLSTEKALQKLSHETFTTIICDPPSASSDGNKITNALKSYETLLPLMLSILCKNEGKLFVFLNTHTVSWNKFEEKLKSIIDSSIFKDKISIGKRFKLTEDCVPLKGFHEGDYLKGLLIEFKKGSK